MACVTLKRPLELEPFETLHSPNRPPTKRRRCTPMRGAIDRETAASYVAPTPVSVFRASTLTPIEIANNLRDELKRARRRRQLGGETLHHQRQTPSPTLMASPTGPLSPASDCMMDSTAGTAEGSRRGQDKPVFTLKQMTMICERMCREQNEKVREEYDRILQQKLSEQYDAFVRFIDHQIQQRFNQAQLPSYLS